VGTYSYRTASRCLRRHYGKRFSNPAWPNYPCKQSLTICDHRTICQKANSNAWRAKSRRRKCGIDSKRGAFNNSNRLRPTPETTALPRRQDNSLLHRRRRAFHIIRLPLRRLPHPLRPLLTSHLLSLAQDPIARLVAMAVHLPHPLIAKMVLRLLCVCSASMMMKIALSQYNAPNLPSPPNACSNAVYVWRKCPWIQSPASIPVDIPSAVNVSEDTSPHE